MERSTNKMKHIEDINRLISQRERQLNAKYESAAKIQAQIAAEAAEDAARLQPEKDAIAAERRALGGLITQRDNLTEQIRIAKIQLAQQDAFLLELDALSKRIVGHSHDGRPDALEFQNNFRNHPHLPVAPLLVQKIKSILIDLESELEAVDGSLLDFTKSRS